MADEATTKTRNRKRRTNSSQTSDCPSFNTEATGRSKYFSSKDKKTEFLSKRKKAESCCSDKQLVDGGVGKTISKGKDEKLPKNSPYLSPKKLGRTFYDVSTIELANNLLGKCICRVLEDGEVLAGRIVETEGYLGENDKACHTYGGKRTQRNEAMYMVPGTAYVYFIYGMYYCLNISSEETGACVLIRALEPVKGPEIMRKLRGTKHKDKGAGLKEFQLCNGPSKLCQALNINKANLNKEDMAVSSQFWIEDAQADKDFQIVTSNRIGINSYGPEAASQPLRFYVLGSKSVSIGDKKAEVALDNQ